MRRFWRAQATGSRYGQKGTTVEKWLGQGLRNLCRPVRSEATPSEDVSKAGWSDGWENPAGAGKTTRREIELWVRLQQEGGGGNEI